MSFNFMAAVTIFSILEPKQIKSLTVCIVSPSIWFLFALGHKGGVICISEVMDMQSTSLEMPDWMKYKLESRLQGEISIISDLQMALP